MNEQVNISQGQSGRMGPSPPSTSPVLIHSLIPPFTYSFMQQILVEHLQKPSTPSSAGHTVGKKTKSSVLREFAF